MYVRNCTNTILLSTNRRKATNGGTWYDLASLHLPLSLVCVQKMEARLLAEGLHAAEWLYRTNLVVISSSQTNDASYSSTRWRCEVHQEESHLSHTCAEDLGCPLASSSNLHNRCLVSNGNSILCYRLRFCACHCKCLWSVSRWILR